MPQSNGGNQKNVNKGMANKSRKGGTKAANSPAVVAAAAASVATAAVAAAAAVNTNKTPGLYPKIRRKRPTPKSYYNKEELLVQYQNQKKAEAIFFNLQRQKAYVEEMIAG